MQSLPPGSPRLANGRFVVVGRQRRGTISSSWRVFDQELADWRTLRIVDPNIATREDAQRFSAISQELVHLDHPNMVQAVEVGTLRGGVPFLLTEYVPGGTLARGLARNGALGPRGAGLFIIEVVDALIALHDRGVVHREVAAEHVLVAPNGAARLTDFDLAVREGDVSRRVAGVASYRAPEQLAAEADPSRAPGDFRTDVFAVGVLLWTLLHGEVPRAVQRMHSDPNVLADIDPLLAPILAQCLGYHPEDRYPTMAALSEDLLRTIGELPEEGEAQLVTPPDEQAVTQNIVELGRVADSSTDQTPAWLEERPMADPITYNTPGSGSRPAPGPGPGKTFQTTKTPADAPAGKWFESPPSVPAAMTPHKTIGAAIPAPHKTIGRTPAASHTPHKSWLNDTTGGGSTPSSSGGSPEAKPSLRVPDRPTPKPSEPEVIGAAAAQPDPEPTWLERSMLPMLAGAGALAMLAVAFAAALGVGMVQVEGARAEAEEAQDWFLQLMDAQRRAVEQSVNDGAPGALEQRYLDYTEQRGEGSRIRAAEEFVSTLETLGYGGAPDEGSDSATIAARQLVSSRDRVERTQAAWRDASSSLLGGLAVGVGLARGYEE